MGKKKNPPRQEEARVHPDLKGFRIDVDELGRIRMNRTTEEMGRFLKDHLHPEEEQAGKDEEEEEEREA